MDPIATVANVVLPRDDYYGPIPSWCDLIRNITKSLEKYPAHVDPDNHANTLRHVLGEVWSNISRRIQAIDADRKATELDDWAAATRRDLVDLRYRVQAATDTLNAVWCLQSA